MKRKLYALYQITNHADFSLALIQMDFKTYEEASNYMQAYAARCVIMEYYE